MRGLVRDLLAFLVDVDGALPPWSTATSFLMCALGRALEVVMLVACLIAVCDSRASIFTFLSHLSHVTSVKLSHLGDFPCVLMSSLGSFPEASQPASQPA